MKKIILKIPIVILSMFCFVNVVNASIECSYEFESSTVKSSFPEKGNKTILKKDDDGNISLTNNGNPQKKAEKFNMDNSCPEKLYFTYGGMACDSTMNAWTTEKGVKCSTQATFKLVSNISSDNNSTTNSDNNSNTNSSNNSNDVKLYDIVTCGNNLELPEDLVKLISIVITAMQVAVPIILIVMGMLDFAKAASASKEEDMKKAQQSFVRRLIAGACVFLVICVVKIAVGIVNTDDSNDMLKCVDKLLNGETSTEKKSN